MNISGLFFTVHGGCHRQTINSAKDKRFQGQEKILPFV